MGSVQLAGFGAVATFSAVVLAVVVRPPLPDELELESESGHPSAASSASASAGPTRPAAATTSSSSHPPAVGRGPSAESRETWDELGKDLGAGRFKDALGHLEVLLEQDPDAPRDRAVRDAIVELAMRLTFAGGPEADRLYELVVERMGTAGIDILYELMTTRGGSQAAARASELLADPEVRARGTPALRIAYDLFTTKRCEDKPKLFARAAKDGDWRALGQLQLLNRSCRRRQPCCFHNDPELKAAMDAIKAR